MEVESLKQGQVIISFTKSVSQKEEEEVDSFGEDEYNQNVDPDSFKIDEENRDETETPEG